jgi:hypothetical protein
MLLLSLTAVQSRILKTVFLGNACSCDHMYCSFVCLYSSEVADTAYCFLFLT